MLFFQKLDMISTIIKYCDEKVIISRIAHVCPPFNALDIIFYADAMFLLNTEPFNPLRGLFSALRVRAITNQSRIVSTPKAKSLLPSLL